MDAAILQGTVPVLTMMWKILCIPNKSTKRDFHRQGTNSDRLNDEFESTSTLERTRRNEKEKNKLKIKFEFFVLILLERERGINYV